MLSFKTKLFSRQEFIKQAGNFYCEGRLQEVVYYIICRGSSSSQRHDAWNTASKRTSDYCRVLCVVPTCICWVPDLQNGPLEDTRRVDTTRRVGKTRRIATWSPEDQRVTCTLKRLTGAYSEEWKRINKQDHYQDNHKRLFVDYQFCRIYYAKYSALHSFDNGALFLLLLLWCICVIYKFVLNCIKFLFNVPICYLNHSSHIYSCKTTFPRDNYGGSTEI